MISELKQAKPLLSFQCSGVAMVPVGKLFAIQGSLGYRRKGYKLSEGFFADSSVTHITVHYDYLEQNAFTLLRCNANANYKLYAGLGLYSSYLINGELNNYRFRLENLHRVDLGVNLEILLLMHQRWTIALASDLGGVDPFGRNSSANISSGLTLGYFIN